MLFYLMHNVYLKNMSELFPQFDHFVKPLLFNPSPPTPVTRGFDTFRLHLNVQIYMYMYMYNIQLYMYM